MAKGKGDIGEQNNARRSAALGAGNRSITAQCHRATHTSLSCLHQCNNILSILWLMLGTWRGRGDGRHLIPASATHTGSGLVAWGDGDRKSPKWVVEGSRTKQPRRRGVVGSWSSAWNGRVSTVPSAAAFPAEVLPLDVVVQRYLPRSFCRDWQRGSPCIPSSLAQHKPGPNSTFQQINGQTLWWGCVWKCPF